MRIIVFVFIAMSFFAANSLLCRLALAGTGMDAPGFTILRIVSGALVLWLFMTMRGKNPVQAGSFGAALALFLYMLLFSLAYLNLPAATGTLIIMVAVQAGMLWLGFKFGERARGRQLVGIGIAVLGVIFLLWPGLSAPPLPSSIMMCGAGFSWAVYSVFGKSLTDPSLNTSGNFIRCLPFTLLLLPFCGEMPLAGIVYAVISGAVTSALGYVIWYSLISRLSLASAAVVQLSIPILTLFGATLVLDEPITARLIISSAIILLGIVFAELRPRNRIQQIKTSE